MKKLLLFLFVMLVALVLGACTTGEDAGEEPSDDSGTETETTEEGQVEEEGTDESTGEKILYLNNGIEPTSLDPSIGFDQVSWDPLNNLMEGLTRQDENHQAAAG